MSIAYEERYQHEEGFGVFFAAHIAPVLEEVETARLAARKEFNFRLAISFIVGIPVFAAAALFGWDMVGPEDKDIFATGGILAAAGAGFWVNRPRKRFLVAFKKQVLEPVARFFDLDFEPDGLDLCTEFTDTGILHEHDERAHEDCFRGRYRDVNIAFEEIRLIRVRRTKRGKRRTTVFDGIAVILRMNKEFQGHTIVKEDLGSALNWFRDKVTRLETVTLEDPRFEDTFEVFSTDQVEARYLLTPAFMDRLLAVSDAFGGAKLRACFLNNRLYLLIPYKKDLFEAASLSQTVLETEPLRKVLVQINALRGIVDALKLNEKLGI